MNMINKLAIFAISILSVINIEYAFATNSTTTTTTTTNINQHCTQLKSMMLCDNTNICPQGYHVCNTFDLDIIKLNEESFTTIENAYYTNVGSLNNKCYECNQNPYSSLLTIEPYVEFDVSKHEKTCSIDNKKVPLNTGVKISPCIICICDNSQTRCVNTCVYDSTLSFINQVNTNLGNCVGLEHTNPNNLRCSEQKQMSNVACCRDNSCHLRNCRSCMNYGQIEMCNKCVEGTYFNWYSKNKCHSIELIEEICENSYELNDNDNTFRCTKCLNGNNIFNQTEYRYRCVCNSGWYGVECERNYNSQYCSGNGIYDVENKYCLCNAEYSGTNCDINLFFACNNGIYSSEENKCVCKYGYTGDSCNEKITCIHGSIVDTTCICNQGFSGEDCSIPYPENEQQTASKREYLEEYFRNPCKHGTSINDTCVCNPGYNGFDCGNSECLNGIYNSINNDCVCFDNYYGNKCEYNCQERCSYNGDICKNGNTCICNVGWYGDKCQLFNLRQDTNKFEISSSLNLTYDVNSESLDNYNIQITMLTNRLSYTLPFKVVSTSLNNYTQYRLLQSGSRQQNNFNYGANLIINTTIGLSNTNDVYYIYPDNMVSKSYLSGKNINITLVDTTSEYYIYVEPLRSSTGLYVDDTNDIDGNTNSSNNNSTMVENKKSFSIFNFIKQYFVYASIIGTLFIFALVFFVIRKVKDRKQVTRRVIKNIHRNNANGNISGNVDDAEQFNVEVNPYLRSTSSNNLDCKSSSENRLQVSRNKVEYAVNISNHQRLMNVYKSKTDYLSKQSISSQENNV